MMKDTRSWDLRLGYLIHDVSRLRRVSYDRELAPLGITRKDGLPQTQLAHELDVGKVALGSLIDRLQTAGFVERRADEKDRRVKRVFLTKKALKLIKDIGPINDSFNARILRGIPRNDLEVTSQTLYTMKNNLLALMSERHGSDLDALDEEEVVESKPRRRPRVSVL
jgi:DNA-binding MarR family transcriptional regulator